MILMGYYSSIYSDWCIKCTKCTKFLVVEQAKKINVIMRSAVRTNFEKNDGDIN